MPFIFEKLDTYQKALQFTKEIILFLKNLTGEPVLKDQFKRAVLSVPLNIAEGGGRFSKAEKRNFYIIARGSVNECVAILQILFELQLIGKPDYDKFYKTCEDLSKLLSALIRSLE